MKALAALIVTSMFAIPATSSAPLESAPVEQAVIAPVQTAALLNGRAHRGCKCWGRVLDIRRIEATGAAPASFEFTVRMYDGSLHMTPSTSVGSWKVGDRIFVSRV